VREDFLTDEKMVTKGKLIVIDAGHQAKADTSKEPIGLGATETKMSLENASANSMMMICQTVSNPYNGNVYQNSKSLSTYVLDEMTASTEAKKERVWETDTMSGINWC